MTRKRYFAIVSLLLVVMACSKESPRPSTAPTPPPSSTPFPTSTTPPLQPTDTPMPSPTQIPPSPTAPPTPPGPSVTNVQFALDVDEFGQLVRPGDAFVFGVTRVYARFDYRGLGDVIEAQSTWYLNNNVLTSGVMTWDGGDGGAYILWAQDPNGMGKGEWRWEFAVDDTVVGGGAFTIGGEPRYANPAWGLSLDQPTTWKIISEEKNFVTFSSPDQQQALALHVIPLASGLTETLALSESLALTQALAADLATFQQSYPDLQVVESKDVTISGEKALLQQARYTDPESGERVLYIACTLYADSAYNVWMVGPADGNDVLRALLMATLRSIRLKEMDE
jgi:hypothetical protein